MATLYFEDFTPGRVFELGDRVMSEDDIVAFAREWDPQPFHLDRTAAANGHFGGLIASGWHTAALYMRLLVDGFLGRAAAMGSPGVDELRWLKPVRPDDVLHGRLEILEVRPSQSRPDRGLARCRSEVLNQHGEAVLTFVATIFFRRREP
jgi:acyl dehydratase